MRFLLGRDAAPYASLARLLQRVRHWRATEVYEGDELVSCYLAGDIKVTDCPFSANRLAFGMCEIGGGAL
jgi:hypothetical protein